MGVFSAGRQRGTEVVGDMLRSIAVVLAFVVIAGVYFIFWRPRTDPVRVIDYTTELRTARSVAPYHVLAPAGLPPDWRATSARHEPPGGGRTLAFHLGFVTPAGDYADLDESNAEGAPFVRSLLGKPKPLSAVTVGGASWQQLRGDRDELALVRVVGGEVTVVVHGSAELDELVRLAGGLR